MESSSASERTAADWSDGGRGWVRDGVRMDDEWEHQPVCGISPGRKSV